MSEKEVTPTENIQATAPQSTPVFQANMKRLREKVKAYFLSKSKANLKPITDIITPEQYNTAYHLIDSALADIVSNIAGECTSRRAFHLSYKPNFQYGTDSLLRAKSCNCAHNPVPVKKKKTERLLAEKFISDWEKACNDWIGKGMLQIFENDIYNSSQAKAAAKQNTSTQPAQPEKRNYIVRKFIK
jgi:hypothetical protein